MDKPNIEIKTKDWEIVQKILQTNIPQYQVWAFGSRVSGRAKPYSDLDLVVIADQPLDLGVSAALNEDFAESDLAYKVDIVDWASLDESFQKVIKDNKVIVQN